VLPIRYVETDQKGYFIIDHLSLGLYKVHTLKEEDKYPNTLLNFYSDGREPTVILSSQSPIAKITITLAPKAGTLAGSISDAVTGAPLRAGVHLWRANNPSSWMETSLPEQYSVLIPVDTAIGIKVQAPGYTDWYYPGTEYSSKAGRLCP